MFLMPIAFGLLATAFRLDFFRPINFSTAVWMVIFLAPLVPMFYAVDADIQVFPTPDRISATEDQQENAIAIDECLRRPDCAERERYLKLVLTCQNRKSEPNDFTTKRRDLLSKKGEDYSKVLAYVCALMETEQSRGKKLEMSPMVTIIFFLKIILALFVWSYVCYTFFLAFNRFKTVDQPILYSLIGILVLWVTWLPLQLYAEWYHWYGNVSHIMEFNGSFAGFFILAIILTSLFVPWLLVIRHRTNAVTTVGAIHTTGVALVGMLLYFEPKTIDKIFTVVGGLPASVFVLLSFVFLIYIVTYVRLLIIFVADEAAQYATSNRTS